jgi:hypothetical protein
MAGGSAGDRVHYSAGVAHLNVMSGLDGDDPARTTSGQGRITFRLLPSTTLSGRIYSSDSFVKLNTGPQAIGTLPRVGIIDAVPLSTFTPSADDPDNSRAGRFFSGAVILSSHPTRDFGYAVSYHGLIANSAYASGPAGVSFQPAGNTRSEFDGRIQTVNARMDLRLGRFNFINGGYEFENENYGNRSFQVKSADNSSAGVTERSHTLFFQDQVRLLDDRLLFSAAFRTQRFALDRPEFNPATSAPYRNVNFEAPPNAYTGDGSFAYFFRGTGTKIRGHVGNGYRAPSLYERFGTAFGSFGYSIYGDPRLRPERSLGFDAGVDQRLFDRVRAAATYFYTRLQRIIIFDFSGAIQPAVDPFGRLGGYRTTNGGLARGLELSAILAPTKSLDVSVAYTFTKAAQRTPIVPGVIRSFAIPDHQFSAVATQRFGRRIFVNFDLNTSSDYLAPIFDPGTFASRAFRFGGIRKADLGASYRLFDSDLKNVRLFGKVENVFNQTYYEMGFRTPGATAIGGMQVEF